MNYQINDLFGYKENYDYLDGVIKRVLEKENALDSIFSIIFVDEEKIQDINKTYRKIDRVTDVISFALEDQKDDIDLEMRILGDIFICIPRMQEQANSYGHSEKRELAFLAVHGLLHLLGYDHQTKEDEEIMFGLQKEILDEEGIKR